MSFVTTGNIGAWLSSRGFMTGPLGILHARQLGVGWRGVQDHRLGRSPSLQVVTSTGGSAWLDVDRFNPYAGLVYAIAHLFGEVIPGILR